MDKYQNIDAHVFAQLLVGNDCSIHALYMFNVLLHNYYLDVVSLMATAELYLSFKIKQSELHPSRYSKCQNVVKQY